MGTVGTGLNRTTAPWAFVKSTLSGRQATYRPHRGERLDETTRRRNSARLGHGSVKAPESSGRRKERVQRWKVDRRTEDHAMTTLSKLLFICLLAWPLAAFAQSGGAGGAGGGGGTGGGASSSGGAGAGTSGTGAASGPTAGSPSAAGTPSAGSAGAGSQAVSGVPNGPANLGGNNNSGNDPSGAGNASKVPTAPGTNSLGTANSTGGSSSSSSTGTGSQTTGSALNRPGGQSGGRIDGTVTQGPEMPGDAAIRAEDQVVDKKIKSICKGC
jgi:hypothetical protein